MPPVFSDAGPLINLSQAGQLQLLRRLFGEILITQKVKWEACDEGLRRGHVDAVAIEAAVEDGWLRVTRVPERLVASAVKLAAGENVSKADAECLLLAVDRKAELLVDDKLLSSLAKMYGLKVWGSWTLLLEALSRNLVAFDDVKASVEELGKRKFRLNPGQAREIIDAAKFDENQKNEKR